MAKIFNNIDRSQFAQSPLSGWDADAPAYSSTRIGQITDTVGAGIALQKMGTSIPTPLARIHLFKTAFEQVNNLGADTDSVYGKLVSECLDMLEFIYHFGNQITIKNWNVQENINLLKDSFSEGHQKLGKSFEQFVRDLNVKNIYLFYYQDVLIGGSSPYTLVYTSPNWQRLKPIADVSGLAGNQLFPDYADIHTLPTPLYQRHDDFRKFLTRYIVAFNSVQRFRDSGFRKYIYNNQQVYDAAMKTFYNQLIHDNVLYGIQQLRNDYMVLNNGADIDVYGDGVAPLLLAAENKTDVIIRDGGNTGGSGVLTNVVADDYKIKATASRYTNHYNGGQIPLVLNDFGLTGAKYIGGLPWKEGTVLERNCHEELQNRILPGNGNVKYPYLTDADFLEDQLLKVIYEIDDNAFFLFGGSAHYLLPFKKAFFEYFDVEDINKKPGLAYSLQELPNGSVEVRLTIPVQCSHTPCIELKKVYDEKLIKTIPAQPGFSMAVFPSYKVLDGNVPNIYSVMLHDAANAVSAKFYALKPEGVTESRAAEAKARTENVSKYVKVEEAFDFVEVEWNDVHALAIPHLKKVTFNSAARVTVGIDFGTTNSYACVSFAGGTQPQTFEITRDDLQVLLLNKIDLSEGNYGQKYQASSSMMPAFAQALDREYTPLLMGTKQEFGRAISDISLPYRTVTCETNNFGRLNDASLFADINVGFNYMKETINVAGVKYNSDIKWAIEKRNAPDPVARENRVKAFCLQFAWMLKSKVMLSDAPTNDFDVYLTFPFTMKEAVQDKIRDFWTEAFREVMGADNVRVDQEDERNNTIHTLPESIAPYYFMLAKGDAALTRNAVNIDVGGGTTDMLFVDVKNKSFYYDSSLFAGNDIWGDGTQLINFGLNTNGFVDEFEQRLAEGSIKSTPERNKAYEDYKSMVMRSEMANKSADIMAYIFRYDNEFKFTRFLKDDDGKLKAILFVHFAGLVYHVAQVLKEKNIEVPEVVSLTGKGSEYIRLIGSEAIVSRLFKGLLAAFMGYGFSDEDEQMPRKFKVIFQENPKEVTAQGAMLANHARLSRYDEFKRRSLCVYGVQLEDGVKSVRYGEAQHYKDKVMADFDNFIDLFLHDEEIQEFIDDTMSVRLDARMIENTLRDAADNSFDVMADSRDAADRVKETFFFWPLKNGLYELSKL